MRWIVPVGRSGWAIAAGYVGLFGLAIPFLAPFSIVLGVVAIRDIRRRGVHGMGRAIFGIVSGVGWILGVLVWAIVAAMSG